MRDELEYLAKDHFCPLESQNKVLNHNMIQILLLEVLFVSSKKDSFMHACMNLEIFLECYGNHVAR